LEISGLPPKNLLNYFPDLEKNIDKIVYGSDWPGIKTISSNIEAIKKLPLSEGSIKKILYGNAARILGL
ncbi:MAG: amidohydrolase family protein, partial [Candidatus Aminicenantes bacterium]|nr:amidohydrolase family protein [Candidatus Aminicenantes bacterium]